MRGVEKMKYKEKIKRHFMKNPANKDEINSRDSSLSSSIAQKTELTMRKQKTSVNVTTNQKMDNKVRRKPLLPVIRRIKDRRKLTNQL